MTIQDKSREEFEQWWNNYHKGTPGKAKAWDAWHFGRSSGYQRGWAEGRKYTEKELEEIRKLS
jgi:hypothetical protein